MLNKDKQSSILECNPQLLLNDNIYQDSQTQIRDSKLSNYIQIASGQVFASIDDASLFSHELESALSTPELRTELAYAPYNFLLSFDFTNINTALDLTQDFGGVAHFLAQSVQHVDSVKIDSGHARLALKRFPDSNNIRHISEDIDTLKFPKAYYDLILISELDSLNLDTKEQIELLKRLKSALNKEGKLVVNTLNRGRLSKWMAARPSAKNGALAYQNLYQSTGHREFNFTELRNAIETINFAHVDYYASFSSDERMQNLFAQEYLESNPDVSNHFYRIGSLENEHLNEYLLYKKLLRNNKNVFEMASRYLLVAGNSSSTTRQIFNNSFSHFSGGSRKPEWRTTTQCERDSNIVTKTPVHKHLQTRNTQNDNINVTQNVENQHYCHGRILLDDWVDALIRHDYSELNTLINEYSNWLQELEKQADFTLFAYDLLPFNIVLNDKRDYQIIDPEWQVRGDYDAEFILFRALFWFAFENKSLFSNFAETTGHTTIGLFINHFMPNVLDVSTLKKFAFLEESVQRLISRNFKTKSVEHGLYQPFSKEFTPAIPQLSCQISWSDDNNNVDEANSTFSDWEASAQPQTIRLPLPKYKANTPLLRVDPMAAKGLFILSVLRVLDEDGGSLWCTESNELCQIATLHNVSLSTRNEIGDQNFISLNDDPYLLFDSSKIPNIENATDIEIVLSLVYDQNYDKALDQLSTIVDQQNQTMAQQASTINQRIADLDYLTNRLNEVDSHRADLKQSLHNLQRDSSTQTRKLSEQLAHLNSQLAAQYERNHLLEQSLRRSPSARLRRLARRSLEKMRGG